MSDLAISVENLSKLYRIGATQARHDTLRDAMTGIFRRPSPLAPRPSDTDLWALKDVSFGVQQGEVVGIIGRNGAGKSTLLKILSRITEPTSGRVALYGRVASLLEVGTGFHPELTGRENIYLNGAILGMKRREIDRKFDEIVDFAEIERFLDTPVKRYSSGMYVRLAFAVAAHLEPEILLVDEVLAVGDAVFQKKCLGKMGDVAKEGRTVLFVSHNMTAIRTLCRRAILLANGQIAMSGATELVAQSYLRDSVSGQSEQIWPYPGVAPGDDTARVHKVRLCDQNGRQISQIDIACSFNVEVDYWVLEPDTSLNISISIYSQDGIYVLASASSTDSQWYGQPHPQGLFRSVCTVPGAFLNQGIYSISALLVNTDRFHVLALLERIVSIEVHDDGDSRRGYYGGWGGVVRPTLSWHTDHLSRQVEAATISFGANHD